MTYCSRCGADVEFLHENTYEQMSFSGRIRRLGIEISIAIVLLAVLKVYINDGIWINAIIVLIASAFLYDIWCIADFQETHFSMSQLKGLIAEED